MEWLTKIIEIVKLPLKYFWLVLIISSFLLFSPAVFIQSLGMEKIGQDYRIWIGISFIVSIAMLIVALGEAIAKQVRKKWLKAKLIKEAEKELKQLDPKEKAILREFAIQDQDSIQLPINQVSVAGLLRKGILVQSGLYGERSLAGLLFPVTIRKEIRRILTGSDIDLPQHPTEQDIQRVREARPEFLEEIEQHNDIFHTAWTKRRLFR